MNDLDLLDWIEDMLNSDDEDEEDGEFTLRAIESCNTLSTGCDSSCNTTDVVQAPKKRRVRWGIPRLLVHDVRRLYSKMFANVFNTGDFVRMFGFVDTYYHPNAQYSVVLKDASDNIQYGMFITGAIEIMKFGIAVIRMCPDNILKMSDEKFYRASGTISCVLHKEYSHIYAAPTHAYYAPYVFVEEQYGKEILYTHNQANNTFILGRRRFDKSVQITDSEKYYAKCDDKVKLMQCLIRSVERSVCTLPLLRSPIGLKAKGTVKFTTDVNKKIINIEQVLTF